MKHLLSSLILLCLSQAIQAENGIEPHIKAIQDRDPNHLGYFVGFDEECPFDGSEAVATVSESLENAGLVPTFNRYHDPDEFGLSAIVQCFEPVDGWSHYSLTARFTYVHNGMLVEISRAYGSMGVDTGEGILDQLKQSITKAVADYQLANPQANGEGKVAIRSVGMVGEAP